MRFLLAILLMAMFAGCVGTSPVDDVAVPEPMAQSVFDGDFRFPDSRSLPLVDGVLDVLDGETQVIASEVDGKDIAMTVWRPDLDGATAEDLAAANILDGKVPVLIQASPYYTRSANRDGLGNWLSDVIVPHGYAFVALALRSTGDSGGCDDFRGPNMVADISQAIDHIIEQEWASEDVAFIGISYHGGTPWYAAGSGHPAVKTIVPISGTMNAWEVYLRNGTPEVRAPAIIPLYGSSALSNSQRDPVHKVDNFACGEVWEAWAYGVSDAILADRQHDAWWDERNAKPKVMENYQGSVFMVHGFEDWNVDPAVAIPFTQQFADSGREVKQLVGQWGHTYPDTASDANKRYDWAEILLRWFDRELKGLDVDVGPAVQVQDNQGAWRDEAAWPPKDATHLRFAVADGLPAQADLGTAQVLTPAEWLTFSTGPLDEDMRIAGLPKVHVNVTPLGPSGYMGAFLLDKAPDGTEKRIGWTGMNFRFADGTETPKDVTPNEPLLLKMEIQPMDAVVPAGHELVLRIGGVVPGDRIMPPHPYPYIFAHGDGFLEVPVIERGPDVFFEPPQP